MRKYIIILTLAFAYTLSAQTNATDYYNRGVKKVHIRDYEGAKKDFEKALEIDPNYANAHNNYALLLIKQYKDTLNAKKHYEKALSLDPKNAVAHFNYAIMLKDHTKNKEKAKKEFEKAIELNPKFPMAHLNYAILLKDQFNDKEAAKKQYMIATSQNRRLINSEFDVDFEIIRTKIDKF